MRTSALPVSFPALMVSRASGIERSERAVNLPDDVRRFVLQRFPPDEQQPALDLLAQARIETGEPATERMLRCAVFASGGHLDRLERYVSMLAIDWRDVIVAGEYERRGTEPVHVRDLSQPFTS